MDRTVDSKANSTSTTSVTANAWKIMPVFRAQSREAAISFYVDLLGFDRPSIITPARAAALIGQRRQGRAFFSLRCGKPSHRRSVIIYFIAPEGSLPPGHVHIFLRQPAEIDAIFAKLAESGRFTAVEQRDDRPGNPPPARRWCMTAVREGLGLRELSVWDMCGNRIDFAAIVDVMEGDEADETPDDADMSSDEWDEACDALK